MATRDKRVGFFLAGPQNKRSGGPGCRGLSWHARLNPALYKYRRSWIGRPSGGTAAVFSTKPLYHTASSHSHGLSYRMRLDTLGAGIRAGQDGRGSTADVAGAGSAIAPLPWRWSNWPGPAPAEGAPQSLGAQLPVVARLPLPPVHLRPKAGAERSGGRRCSFRK